MSLGIEQLGIPRALPGPISSLDHWMTDENEEKRSIWW